MSTSDLDLIVSGLESRKTPNKLGSEDCIIRVDVGRNASNMDHMWLQMNSQGAKIKYKNTGK